MKRNLYFTAIVLAVFVGWLVCHIIDSPAQRGRKLFESTTFYVDYVDLKTDFKVAARIEDSNKRAAEMNTITEKKRTLFEDLRNYLDKKNITAIIIEPEWHYNRKGETVTCDISPPIVRIVASQQ